MTLPTLYSSTGPCCLLVPVFRYTRDGPFWVGWWCWGDWPARVVRPRA